jgi:hypothetical protein
LQATKAHIDELLAVVPKAHGGSYGMQKYWALDIAKAPQEAKRLDGLMLDALEITDLKSGAR